MPSGAMKLTTAPAPAAIRSRSFWSQTRMKYPKKRRRGAARKFEWGDLVQHHRTGQTLAVVGYGADDRPYSQKPGRKYRAVPYHVGWRMAWGRARWFDVWELIPLTAAELRIPPKVRGVRTVYLANRRLGGRQGRGCDCQCCAHVALPPGMTKNERFDQVEGILVAGERKAADAAFVRACLRASRQAQAVKAGVRFGLSDSRQDPNPDVGA